MTSRPSPGGSVGWSSFAGSFCADAARATDSANAPASGTSARMNVKFKLLLRQCKGDDFIIGDFRPGEPAAGAHDCHELASVRALVGNRRRLHRRRQPGLPQLLAGRGCKGAEPEVVGAAD